MASIKLTNSVTLDISSVYGIKGINQSNKLVSATWGSNTTYSWTATEYGYAVIRAENNTVSIYIDNVQVCGLNNYTTSQPIPIKKGQVLKCINSDSRVTNNSVNVYGLK